MKTTAKFFASFLLCLVMPLVSVYGNDQEQPHKAGERIVLTIKDMEYPFRWCPAGTFMMGSSENEANRNPNETYHRVTLSQDFWMLEILVTQEMWKSVMGDNPSKLEGIKLPVEQVSWNDCQEYIMKLNDLKIAPAGYKFALPTEAQWEYACRAGTTTAYHCGNTLDRDKANFDNNLGQTSEVGKYPANAWGLYDMHGNVWEWCTDLYREYSSDAITDPMGADVGWYRVIRGGFRSDAAQDCRAARRLNSDPTVRCYFLGCRLALVRAE